MKNDSSSAFGFALASKRLFYDAAASAFFRGPPGFDFPSFAFSSYSLFPPPPLPLIFIFSRFYSLFSSFCLSSSLSDSLFPFFISSAKEDGEQANSRIDRRPRPAPPRPSGIVHDHFPVRSPQPFQAKSYEPATVRTRPTKA